MRWEYVTVQLPVWNYSDPVTFSDSSAPTSLISVLDELGADGWELVSVLSDDKDKMPHYVRAILKRPASE